MIKHLSKLLLAVAGTITGITSVNAAEYIAGFMIDGGVSRNDNIRLVQNNKTAVEKYRLSPSLILSANTETNKLTLDSKLDFNRFDKSEFNSDDQNISLDYTHQFETSSIGIDASYTHNTTLTSEQLTTGRVGTKADRAELYNIAPNWIYTLSESNMIRLDATYSTQNYENSAYIGYENTGAGLSWIHVLNERIKLIATANYSDYQSDNLPYPGFPPGFLEYSTRTKSENLQLGSDYQLSEQIALSARLGRSRNDTTYPVHDLRNICALISSFCESPHNVRFGSTAQINGTWIDERQQISIDASKATQPTSNGYAVDSIRAALNWSYQLSELDKISTGISLVRNRAIDEENNLQNASLADRDYGAATLRYQRTLTEYWFLTTSFEYSGQEYIETDYRASGRIYSLGITYRPQQWLWSR